MKGLRGASARVSVVTLSVTLWRKPKKRLCRNYRQGRVLTNRGGEIRCRGKAETFEQAEPARPLATSCRRAASAVRP